MDPEGQFKVVSIAAWCTVHNLNDSRKLGEAIAEAIRESDSKVMLLASGSLSHKIWENGLYAETNGTFTLSAGVQHTGCPSRDGSVATGRIQHLPENAAGLRTEMRR